MTILISPLLEKIEAISRKDQLLILIMVASIILMVARCFDNSFWGDECYSILINNYSYSGILEYLNHDSHPPLYHFLMKFVTGILGTHPWVYHFVTVISFIAVMILGATVVRKDFGFNVALIFMLLSSITPVAFNFSTEVRMYEQAYLFVLLVLLSANRFLHTHSLMYASLIVVFSLLAAYTHVFGLMASAMIILGIMIVEIRNKKIFLSIFAGIIIIGIGYSSWMGKTLDTIERIKTDFWIDSNPSIYKMFSYLGGVYDIPLLSLLIFGVVIFVLYISFRPESKLRERVKIVTLDTNEKKFAFVAILGVFGPLVFSYVFSALVVPMFIPRYIYPALPALWILFGICASRFTSRKTVISIILAILVICIPLTAYDLYKERNESQDTDEFLDTVGKLSQDDHIITDVSHFNAIVLSYYYPDCTHELIALNDEPHLDLSKNNWLFLKSGITDKWETMLNDYGFHYEVILEDGAINHYRVSVYRIIST